MKKVLKLFGLIAIVAVIGFSMVACGDDDGGGNKDPDDQGNPDVTLTSIDEFAAWLNAQRENTPAKAYNIKLNVSDLGGYVGSSGSIGYLLYANENKYVRLDLSGSTFTSIEAWAFSECISLTSVTIPNSVTSIEDGAFHKTSLTRVTIPNSVTSIGGWTFSDTGLTSITIPDSVTTIGYSAFCHCTSLTRVTIPDSVTTIGEMPFSWSENLTIIDVAAGNSAYTSENNVLYNKNKTTLIQYPSKKTDRTFIIPNSVTSIGILAFWFCYNLTSVTIPNSVTSIEREAFSGCNGLTSVTIPNSVTSIGDGAFSACYKLTAINVATGNSAYTSENGVLYNKNKTTLMQYPAGKTDSFFTIPNSVTSIGDRAFPWCHNLTSVTIPNSVISIGDDVFSNCESLTSVKFEGAISPDNFNTNAFDSDLRDKYLAGGIGTYTRSKGGLTWRKK